MALPYQFKNPNWTEAQIARNGDNPLNEKDLSRSFRTDWAKFVI